MPPPRINARRDPPRVALRPPPDFEVLTSVYAAGSADGFTLAFDYPDLAVAPGWRLDCRDKSYDVVAVDGRALQCAERGGGS